MKIRHAMTGIAALVGVGLAALPAAAQYETPVIPRSVLFGNPNKASPQISPDGMWLSYLAPVDGVLNIWISPIRDLDAAQPVTQERGVGIRVHAWAHTSEHIVMLRDEAGNGRWRAWVVDLATGEQMPLTPEGATAQIERVSRQFPTEILVSINDRDPKHPDLYRVDITNGQKTIVLKSDGFDGIYHNDAFRVMMVSRPVPDGGRELMVPGAEKGQWTQFSRIAPEDAATTGVVGFNNEGTIVYMMDARGRDTTALKSFDLATGSSKTLAKGRDADVSGAVLMNPLTGEFQAASTTHRRREWQFEDKGVRKDFNVLEKVVDGEISVVSRTANDRQWIVAFERDNGPVEYFHYDRDQNQPRRLFSSQSALDGRELAKMHAVEIKSRDRLKTVVYYSLPPWQDVDQDGKPLDPLPTIVWVNGGPWGRMYWGYHPVHQWLANRGYAVITITCRGASGFGKQFQFAGNGEWGGRMQEDLVDAVQWAIKSKITDGQLVGIMGSGYGGYAAAMAMATAAQTFACGVDMMGPVNLFSYMSALSAGAPEFVNELAMRVGDHRTEQGATMLRDRSPINFAGQITGPLLVAHGANDGRTPITEAEQFAEAAHDAGSPVTFVVYPDETHTFARRANRLSFLAITEAFLARYLGGRYEPVGEDFAGSSVAIPIGSELVADVLAGAE